MNHVEFKRWLSVTVAGSLLVFSGCSSTGSIGNAMDKWKHGDAAHADPIDPDMGLTRDDYKHIAAPKQSGAPTLTIEKDAPPVPKIADILAAPIAPKLGDTQIVSIAVTDDVPLKDVLIELAKLADVDIDIDAGITGGITFIAKDKPFNEVIDRICDLAGLRYSMKDGVLTVERDTPYIKSYSVDFLNVDRNSDSAVNLSTNVLSGSGSGGSTGGSTGGATGGASASSGTSGGGSGGLSTGSTSSVTTKSTGDFWKSFESGVQQILAYEEPKHLSENTMQEEANANPAAPKPAAPAQPAAPAAVGAAGGIAPKFQYNLNRQAGVLTVNADSRQHELIQRYIDELRKNAAAQVLIEAKIIEVDLNDQYSSGINWSTVGTRLGSVLGGGAITTTFSSPLPNPVVPLAANSVQFTTSANPNNIITMLEAFGTIRTLSSPRLHAINNQQSTLTFAENHVYFTITTTASTTTSTTGSSVVNPPTFNSTVNTVPIGIMMTMMPSIDLGNNEVTLAVRPTLSTIIDFVNDPAFELTLASTPGASSELGKIHNAVPEIQVRELDSTLRLKSGNTMVIGGLMQQEATDDDAGVPFISSLPVIGNAFKSVSKASHNKELVLLIKATIVDSHGSLNNLDKSIFHKFSDDPRPVTF